MFSTDVNSMSWSDRAELERQTNLYVNPGEEDVLDENDNGELIRSANEADGIYMGEQIKLSKNLKTWLKRDGWLVNGIPYCLEDAVYSHPVKHWNLPYGHDKPIRTRAPRYKPTDSVAPNTEVLSAGTLYELVVTLKYIKFLQHPSMTQEMRLEAELRKEYDSYIDAHTKMRNSKYQATLDQYRAVWKRKLGESNTFQGLPSSPSKLSVSQLLWQVMDTRKRRNNEHKNVKKYFDKVLDVWTRLKVLRENQRFITSRLNLEVYSLQPPENSREVWEKDVQEELEELRHHSNDLHDDYHRRVRKGESVDQPPPAWDEEQVRDELIQLGFAKSLTTCDHIQNSRENTSQVLYLETLYLAFT